MNRAISEINKSIIRCKQCPRLIEHCKKISKEKRKAYLGETYWGRPVPGFGSTQAKLLVVGLAPAAHGANRTGRMFTGDRSGEWLYRALKKAGFSNQANSTSRDDGLQLIDTYITAVVHCAPPDNKPTTEELKRCSKYLEQEIQATKNTIVIVALGQIAYNYVWKILNPKLKKPKFSHGVTYQWKRHHVIASYHPSQQNTFTGKLTETAFDVVFRLAKQYLHREERE